jgi:serine/threonine-protein kinase PRP4
VGEIINSRYIIKGNAGKGVFSCVVRATDINPSDPRYKEVAIKIIRMFDIMRISGEKEKEIVAKLN